MDSKFEEFSSERKELVSVESDRHVIVRGEGAEHVFELISRFIAEL